MTPEPPRARVAHVDELAELRATASPEPQAFVAMGDRMVPLFGSVNAGLFSAAAAGPATTSDVPAPPSAPVPVAAAAPAPAPLPASETRPPTSAATLRLPPPTPPPQLGLILGGRPSTPEPGAEMEPPTAVRPQAPEAPAAVAASAASIAALLDARAQEDAQRLEQTQADHRAAMATLLREHRDELRAQREADAARTNALLRDVLIEHRAELHAQREADATRTAAQLRDVFAELVKANQAHADQLTQVLAQRPQSADPPTASDIIELRAALLEQATVQRHANEAAAENIDALTSTIADLGHTVGMLAVSATQKAQQSHGPIRATFLPPPRSEHATAHAAALPVDPEPTATSATSPHLEPGLTGPPAATSAPVLPAAPAAANQPTRPSPSVPLADAITSESPRRRSISLKLAQEAAELASVERALEDDDDGDLGPELADDDDPVRRRRLSPCTDIVGAAGEPGDD